VSHSLKEKLWKSVRGIRESGESPRGERGLCEKEYSGILVEIILFSLDNWANTPTRRGPCGVKVKGLRSPERHIQPIKN